MPFKLGVPELIIILLIILVIFGAAKLPQIGGALGKSIREFRKEASNKDEKTEETKVEASKNSSKPEATTITKKDS
ncbi:MAG: twin-arginine translocation protein, TatA/E family subunit [Dehalococcoidia bacterium]|nr:twin-arginine translocation protein, TatA/E family subunit [Dehalococcoidia bacterium]